MRKKTIIAGCAMIGLFLLAISTSFAFDFRDRLDQPPAPRLLSPRTEEVVLTGKEAMEFRWQNEDFFRTRAFEFRLYKGYAMIEGNLIFKQRLEAAKSSLFIKAVLFEDGQVYTWSLRRISFGGEKSDPSFESFRIIKK